MRITLLVAQSLDGFITRHADRGTEFTSTADRAHFITALAEFDCCVMGATTYRLSRENIMANLTKPRLRMVMSRSPNDYAADTKPGFLEFTASSPNTLVTQLIAQGKKNCALLGGAQTYRHFLAARLVDELWVTVEPRLFGKGTPLVDAQMDVALRLKQSEKLSTDTLLLKYDVVK